MILCCLTLVTACGAPSQADAVRGALIIVGSGTEQGAVNAWSNAWVADNRGVSVNYSPDGQDIGIRALLDGSTHVATSDSPLSPDDDEASKNVCGPDGAFSLPTSITPVGVAYNLAGIRGLKLDASTLADIFTGSIDEWNDPRIEALNPTADLPEKDIIPVTSKENSALALTGSTYLKEYSGTWSSEASHAWPSDVAGTRVDKDSEIPQEVDDHFGTIAFMNMGDIGNRFNTFALQFNGKFFTPTTDPINDAIASSEVTSSAHGVSVSLASHKGTGYQLASVSYQVFCSNYKNEPTASLVRSWAEFVVSQPGQTKARIHVGIYSPSDPALRAARSQAATIGTAE
jgi:phosphate transport system substrate-binding protein